MLTYIPSIYISRLSKAEARVYVYAQKAFTSSRCWRKHSCVLTVMSQRKIVAASV